MDHLQPTYTEDIKDQVIARLLGENQLLHEQVNFFRQQAEHFKQQTEQLQRKVEELQCQVEQLRQQLQLQKNGRSSKTSSTPPSQDIGRSNQKSLRPPSTRKTGGQAGHAGTTLEMAEQPDEIITHSPEYCQRCGEKLDAPIATLVSRKQEIILPPVVPQYIEHQSYSCKCAIYGHETISELPAHLSANIQYGFGVNALVGYLSVRHYVPVNRLAGIMRDIFRIPMSEGTVVNILKSLAEKALPTYQQIKSRVEQSSVVGSDETGIKINGKKGWLYTFQTTLLTYLTVSFSRGFDAIETLFNPDFHRDGICY